LRMEDTIGADKEKKSRVARSRRPEPPRANIVGFDVLIFHMAVAVLVVVILLLIILLNIECPT